MKKVEIKPMKYEVTASYFENGDVEIFESYPYGNTVRSILKTKDKVIKEALISLGWTPPSEDK